MLYVAQLGTVELPQASIPESLRLEPRLQEKNQGN